MDHAFKTEEVKEGARAARRTADGEAVRDGKAAVEGDEPVHTPTWRRAKQRLGHFRIEVAPAVETQLRAREVQLLLNVIEPDPAYQAGLVTDEASSLDVSSNSEQLVRDRLECYLRRPLPVDIRTPLWKLVDAIKHEIPGWPEDGLPEPD